MYERAPTPFYRECVRVCVGPPSKAVECFEDHTEIVRSPALPPMPTRIGFVVAPSAPPPSACSEGGGGDCSRPHSCVWHEAEAGRHAEVEARRHAEVGQPHRRGLETRAAANSHLSREKKIDTEKKWTRKILRSYQRTYISLCVCMHACMHA